MFDIIGIESDFFLESIVFSTVDLCHACDTRLDREDLVVVFIIFSDFSWLMWPRANE